jgi:hypothetical protein
MAWRSPTGHKYLEGPATYPIDRTTHLTEPIQQIEPTGRPERTGVPEPIQPSPAEPDPPPF